MRVSSNIMTLNYISRLQNTYKQQSDLMEQADGNKFHRPSDDPVEYARTMRYKNDLSSNDNYTRNVEDGLSWMKASDTKMKEMVSIMSTIQEKTIQAANETNSAADVAAVGAEIEALIEELVNLANTELGGRYLFSGQRDSTQPYVIGSEKVERADIKTLDETQTNVFGYSLTYDASGNAAVTKTGSNQMLKLTDDAGSEYYMNPSDGAIFTKDFVESGYKEVLNSQNLSGKDLYQHIYDNYSVGKFESADNNTTLKSTDGTAVTDTLSKDTIASGADGSTATTDGQTGITVNTAVAADGTTTYSTDTAYKYTDKAGNVITVSFSVDDSGTLSPNPPTVSAVNKNGSAIDAASTNVTVGTVTTTNVGAFSFNISETDANGTLINSQDVSSELAATRTQVWQTSRGYTLEVPLNGDGTYPVNVDGSLDITNCKATDASGNPMAWPGNVFLDNGDGKLKENVGVTIDELTFKSSYIDQSSEYNNYTYKSADGAYTLNVPTYTDGTAATDYITVTDAAGNKVSWKDKFDVSADSSGALVVKDLAAGSELTPTTTDTQMALAFKITDGSDYTSTVTTYPDRGETTKTNNTVSGTDNLFATSENKSQNTIFDLNGQIRDTDNKLVIKDKDGNDMTLSFKTYSQTTVTYLGDDNKISMKTVDGANDPTKDAINATGVDVFGTDLFGNAGTSVLNDLYTIVQRMKDGDTKWLSSDGITLAEQSYSQVLNAETELGAISANYNIAQEMFANQETLITEDITNISGTDIAELAMELQMVSMIYSMALSVGSKTLQNSLADYL